MGGLNGRPPLSMEARVKEFRIFNVASGHDLGIYEGNTRVEALEAMAKDSGYRDYAHACEVVPEFADVLVEEIGGKEDEGA